MAATACHPRIHEEAQIIEAVGFFFSPDENAGSLNCQGARRASEPFKNSEANLKAQRVAFAGDPLALGGI